MKSENKKEAYKKKQSQTQLFVWFTATRYVHRVALFFEKQYKDASMQHIYKLKKTEAIINATLNWVKTPGFT
jgi:hypothetical protein